MANSDVDDDVSDMDAHDIAALRLAIETIRASNDHERIEQIETKLDEDGFYEAGSFAAFVCQTESLDLKPWESPPVSGSESDDERWRDPKANQLLRKMLAAGVSRYHPDPEKAITEAKAVK